MKVPKRRDGAQDLLSMQPRVYEGTVTGRYSDAQSRMLVEVAVVLNGVERLIKKQEYLLGFSVVIGQKVLVEFVPTKTGFLTVVKRDPSARS